MSGPAGNLCGIFPPAVTPFTSDTFDAAALRHNLRRLSASGITGVLALGSNGEFRSLADTETSAVLEVFAAEKGETILMIGTGTESTAGTVANCRRAADFAADYVSVITPSYFAKFMTDEVMLRYYTAVADASPVPVLIYNIPGSTGGVQISPRAVVKLAEHPNIAGMKDSSPAGPARYLAALAEAGGDQSFAVLSGSANTFYPSLSLGAAGGILSLANIIPAECVALYRLYQEGEYIQARRLHEKLMRLNQAVSGRFGVPGVKAAMTLAGFRGGDPRLPLIPVDPELISGIGETFSTTGFPLQ